VPGLGERLQRHAGPPAQRLEANVGVDLDGHAGSRGRAAVERTLPRSAGAGRATARRPERRAAKPAERVAAGQARRARLGPRRATAMLTAAGSAGTYQVGVAFRRSDPPAKQRSPRQQRKVRSRNNQAERGTPRGLSEGRGRRRWATERGSSRGGAAAAARAPTRRRGRRRRESHGRCPEDPLSRGNL
jgi:hypothetical protein